MTTLRDALGQYDSGLDHTNHPPLTWAHDNDIDLDQECWHLSDAVLSGGGGDNWQEIDCRPLFFFMHHDPKCPEWLVLDDEEAVMVVCLEKTDYGVSKVRLQIGWQFSRGHVAVMGQRAMGHMLTDNRAYIRQGV